MYKLMIMALLFNVAVQAEPTFKVKTDYYEVDGKNAKAIRQDMNSKRSGDYDAYTAWWVKWHFYWQDYRSNCALTKVTTDVDVKFTLPKLAANTGADKDARQRWDHYYKSLIEHENGHRDFGVNAAQAIEKALLTMGSRKNCRTLEKDANSLAYSLLNQYIADEKQYDIDTNHGMNKGAVFP